MTVLRWIVWSRFGLLLLSLPTLWVALALDWLRIGTGAYGANTLLVDSSPRLFTLTLLSCLTTALAWKTLRVTWHYGPWRFDRQTPPDPLPDSPWWELALSSALGLSLPAAAWWYTTDTSPPEKQGA